jgi:D-psicose/D-tagatose/L-ribulose 3-epimerase
LALRFGINTLLWTASFEEEHLDLLPRFRDWGFDGVEIARFSFDGFPSAKIRRALEAEGLQSTLCSALTGELSLVSGDAAVRRAAREFIVQGIRTAAELGAGVFLGPFCAPVGKLTGRRRTGEEWKLAVDGLASLGPELDACGVTLANEPLNRFETYFLNTAADARKLCDEAGHQRLGVLLDTFHANIEEKDTGAAVRTLGPRLAHIHGCESDRGIPGTGQVHWDSFFSAIRETGYDGWLVIESFGARIPEIAAAACVWRDLAPSVESIAREGLAFLKRQWQETAG